MGKYKEIIISTRFTSVINSTTIFPLVVVQLRQQHLLVEQFALLVHKDDTKINTHPDMLLVSVKPYLPDQSGFSD